LRIKDGETQKFVIETFGKTYIQTIGQNMGSSANSADNVTHFQGSQGQSLTLSETDLFPQHLLGQLPNFHFIAAISGGRLVKGRFPVLSD
jgi:conjugal transfer pilus assembly protein TraD